jgi:hypothetical protein
MKKTLLLFIVLLTSLVVKSQDIIVKNDGEEIKAKVIEVGVSEIKYKRYDYQEGPLYTIYKRDIYQIHYENGITEEITPKNAPVAPPRATTTPVTPPTSNTITYSMGSYYQGGRYISKARVLHILKTTNDIDIAKQLSKAKTNKTVGALLAYPLGLPLTVIGTIVTMRGAIMMEEEYDVDPDAKGIATVGATMMASGIALQFVNIGFGIKSKNQIKKAIDIYNSKYGDKKE